MASEPTPPRQWFDVWTPPLVMKVAAGSGAFCLAAVYASKGQWEQAASYGMAALYVFGMAGSLAKTRADLSEVKAEAHEATAEAHEIHAVAQTVLGDTTLIRQSPELPGPPLSPVEELARKSVGVPGKPLNG